MRIAAGNRPEFVRKRMIAMKDASWGKEGDSSGTLTIKLSVDVQEIQTFQKYLGYFLNFFWFTKHTLSIIFQHCHPLMDFVSTFQRFTRSQA